MSGELTDVAGCRRFLARVLPVVVVVVIGMLLTGCSSDSKEASGGEDAPSDACTLVTPEEVQAALGGPVGPATHSTQGVGPLPGTGCIYLSAEAPGDAVVISKSVSERSREVFDASRSQADPKTVVIADGGEGDAYVLGESAFVQRGTAIASVVVSQTDQQSASEAAKRLVEAAAKRL